MTVRAFLDRHSKLHARGRALRLKGGIALYGVTLVALLLLLARMGFDLPILWMPQLEEAPGFAGMVLGFLAFSFAGLVQGALLVAVVLLFAQLVRWAASRFLRRSLGQIAATLDRKLATDRYSAALQGSGPLAEVVERTVTANPLPDDALLPQRPGRGQRWLTRGAIALVLLVALTPGTAPGGEGSAPVPGVPAQEQEESPLQLKLLGGRRLFGPDEEITLYVVAEAVDPPEEDFDLAVRMVIDGGEELATGRRLFIPAGAPGQDAIPVELRELANRLKPGEHRAVARAGALESNEFVFTIEAPPEGEDNTKSPSGAQQPEPQPQQGGGSSRPEWQPKFVEPLVREGEKVQKRARVPIEVPGGGAPSEKTLDQAWPELEKRREAALNRPGLSPHTRKLVRDYFDRLRPEDR
ncbi:MAG: hypothetical protein ACYTGV_14410 [Planctomycetota bacterium]|jgi:hypothetical protein